MPCKPIVLCSALLLNQKRKTTQENSFLDVVVNPTLSRRGRARDGRCLPKHLDDHNYNHSHSRSHSHRPIAIAKLSVAAAPPPAIFYCISITITIIMFFFFFFIFF